MYSIHVIIMQRNGRSECSAHNIEARDLFNAVLADINCFADMAVNDEKAVRAIEKAAHGNRPEQGESIRERT